MNSAAKAMWFVRRLFHRRCKVCESRRIRKAIEHVYAQWVVAGIDRE